MPKLVWTPLQKRLSTFVRLLWTLSAHLSEIVNHIYLAIDSVYESATFELGRNFNIIQTEKRIMVFNTAIKWRESKWLAQDTSNELIYFHLIKVI